MSKNKFVCIHGHFYQPPRENPWLEEVELQDSAYPYHDWNERITAQCYAPNTAPRIVADGGTVTVIDSNYSRISFNFGPTLLSWMERHARDIYDAIIDADRESAKRYSGHGSALAQAYGHIIMPLANRNDKITQVVWGIKDFEKRFGRPPEGMWLPETAVDYETLEILVDHGITFTILAPGQAKSVRRAGDGQWQDVNGGKVDPTMPYLCPLPSGKSIVLFFYDGPISQDLAFGDLLRKGENFAGRLLSVFGDSDTPQLAHVATDGETYGHHHEFGDMALGYCLKYLEDNRLARITNYGEYLSLFPPTHEVQIHENSSWSCFHGVERWRSDCGCNSGLHPDWNQAWRKPLRTAFDWLRDTVTSFFEKEMSRYFAAPWKARNDYIGVILDRSPAAIDAFFAANASRELSKDEKVACLKLLELSRNALLMYTSCGWFFDEISGIETVQVLQYSCRVVQLYEELSGSSLEAVYLEYLEAIPTNIPSLKNGARIYDLRVKPAKVDFLRLGAHYVISSLFDEYPRRTSIYCFRADSDLFEKKASGDLRLFIMRAHMTSAITLEEARLSSAVLYLGDHTITAGVRNFISEDASRDMRQAIGRAFETTDIIGVLRNMERCFGPSNYTLADLFRDEQRRLVDKILRPTVDQVYAALRQLCDHHCMMMDFLQNMNIPVSRDLVRIFGFKVNFELKNVFHDDVAVESLSRMIGEAKKWSLDLDVPKISYGASKWVDAMMAKLDAAPRDTALIRKIAAVIGLLATVSVMPNLWKAQNIYSQIDRRMHDDMETKALAGDHAAAEWISAFHRLGQQLHIRGQHEDTSLNIPSPV